MPRAVIRIRPDPAYRREAFEAGLKRIGYTITDGSRDNLHWQPEGRQDLLVLWNRKAGLEERMAETWEARGGTVLVAENGYLQKADKSTYAISTHQHNGAGWFPVGAEDRFSALGFEIKPMVHRPEGYLLVIGQRGIGSKLMASPALWGEKQMAGLLGQNARLRPHPGNFKPKVPLEHELAHARAVRIWSSGAGVRALVEGLPVAHCAPHWICDVQSGYADKRPSALHYMSHGQWTVAEIAAGEPFARMAAENWGPKLWR